MLEKLKKYEGELFHTLTGLPFTYKFINDSSFVIIRDGKEINRTVNISQLTKAIALQPQKPSDIANIIQASAYVFALINDSRLN